MKKGEQLREKLILGIYYREWLLKDFQRRRKEGKWNEIYRREY